MNQSPTLLIVLRSLNDGEWGLIQQKASSNQIRLIVLKDISFDESKFNGIEIIRIKEVDKVISDKELFENVKSLAHKSFGSQGKLINLLQHYSEFNPWYAIKSPLQKASLGAFQLYNQLISINNEIENAKEVIVYSKIDISICFPNRPINFILSDEPQKNGSIQIKYFLVLVSRALIGYFKPIKKGKIWLVNSNLTKQKMYNLEGTELIDGDPFLGYLEDEIGNQDNFQNILVLKNPGAYVLPSIKDCISPYSNIENHTFFEANLLSISGFRAALVGMGYRSDLKRKLATTLINATGFDRFLIKRLLTYSSSMMLSLARYLIARRLIEKYKPMSIVGDDEFTLLKFPIFQAARRLGVDTYAIQHGGISLNNINYSFLEEDMEQGPLPTKTMVWGEMTANQLMDKSIYKQEELAIVGQLRTDVIPALLSKSQKTRLSDKMTVVFASQPLPHNPELRERMFIDFIELNKRLVNQKVFWKPHPNEKKDITSMLAKAEAEGVKIDVFEGDLYGLLSISDVLITNYSTVGSEAIYFDLDLLVLDYTADDGAGYIQNGVGYLCRSVDELETALKALDDGRQLVVPEKRKEYLSQRAYKIDGDVRHRMIDVVKAGIGN